ncbi:Glyoxalase/Bleomycin resistance protein/Dihydroxybiphenyl dioxygenase [Aspergillus karnatakaensis]|uniref:VOC family protein n=1 Tax=Aspergillus karnatakaensis TaxID=1810916 RepID=UPI003CCD5A2D
MLTKHILLSALAAIASLTSIATAQELPPGMTIGSDGPADPETKGYHIYHTGLNVRDLNASKHFYGEILGMRHIFTIQYTPSFSLTYMGFAQGGKNGTGFQTGPELLQEKNNSGGMVKLLYFNNGPEETLVPSTRKTNTFANLGLVVPDIEDAQERLDRFGVRAVKRLGERTAAFDSALANATNVGPGSTGNRGEIEALIEGLLTTDFENIIFVEDPDGNLIEVVAQNGF